MANPLRYRGGGALNFKLSSQPRSKITGSLTSHSHSSFLTSSPHTLSTSNANINSPHPLNQTIPVPMPSPTAGLASSFLAAIQASLSVLLVIFYGGLSAHLNLLSPATGKAISKICVKLFLPALLLTKIGSELHAGSAHRYALILLWAFSKSKPHPSGPSLSQELWVHKTCFVRDCFCSFIVSENTRVLTTT